MRPGHLVAPESVSDRSTRLPVASVSLVVGVLRRTLALREPDDDLMPGIPSSAHSSEPWPYQGRF